MCTCCSQHLILCGRRGLALETGVQAWTTALQGGHHVLPCFRGRDPRRPCESEPPASRGSCLSCRQSYRVCAACVCVRRACACVPCLETCTQALDSCHCVPVCSVTAGRDPSLVCSGSRELLAAGCPQALGHCCVHCAGSTGAPLLPPAPLLPGELPAGPPVCNQSPGRNNLDASKKSAV